MTVFWIVLFIMFRLKVLYKLLFLGQRWRLPLGQETLLECLVSGHGNESSSISSETYLSQIPSGGTIALAVCSTILNNSVK